jgi:hypothetical protein
MEWQEIVIAILGLMVLYLGTQWAAIKKLIKDFSAAAEDDKFTKEEIATIVKDAVAIGTAFKKLWGVVSGIFKKK